MLGCIFLIGQIISIRKVLGANRDVSGKLGKKLAIIISYRIIDMLLSNFKMTYYACLCSAIALILRGDIKALLFDISINMINKI